MSTIETTESEHVTNDSSHKPRTTTLRWWPAVLLLALMLVIKFIPGSIENPPLIVMILGFMGPAVLGVLLAVWWLFASRASWREKLIGIVGLVVIAAVTMAFAHVSMQGMFAVAYQIPTGMAAFGITLVVLAKSKSFRLPVALLATLAGFGYWDLVELHGTTGRFDVELTWRWEPSQEDAYLASLAAGESNADLANASLETLLETSEITWPGFRGKDRNSVVGGISLDTDWESTPPKLIWKRLIGPGWSSFSVMGPLLFTQEQRGEKEAVLCLDAETGDTVWVHENEGRFWEAIGGAGPRATPTIGEDSLFVSGADGYVAALDIRTGEAKWERSLREDAQREPPTWGWSASPLLVGDLVVVHAGGKDDRGVVAYAQDSGEIAWTAPSGDHSYSSPQLASFADTTGILMLTNAGLQFLSPESGDVIWNHEWPFDNYRAIQPFVVDNSVLIGTAFTDGTRKLDVAKEDDNWTVTKAWTSNAMKPEFNDYVACQGYLYGFDGNIFACISLANGERQWKRGRYGNGQVLLLQDAGQLLITSEKGELVVLDATPEKLVELAKFPAIEGKTWNHPVVVGDRVYLRNGQEAACYQLPIK